MGSINTTEKLKFPITSARINYDLAQLENTKMNNKLEEIKMKLLTDDLQKIGIPIKMYDNSGNKRNLRDIAKEINNLRHPDLSMCFVSDKKSTKERYDGLFKYIKFLNEKLGVEIPIYRDPLDPNSGFRNTRDLCENIYKVNKQVEQFLNETNKNNIEFMTKKKEYLDKLKEHLVRVMEDNFKDGYTSYKTDRGVERLDDENRIERNKIDELNLINDTVKRHITKKIRKLAHFNKDLTSKISEHNLGEYDNVDQLSQYYDVSETPDQPVEITKIIKQVKDQPMNFYNCLSCQDKLKLPSNFTTLNNKTNMKTILTEAFKKLDRKFEIEGDEDKRQEIYECFRLYMDIINSETTDMANICKNQKIKIRLK